MLWTTIRLFQKHKKETRNLSSLIHSNSYLSLVRSRLEGADTQGIDVEPLSLCRHIRSCDIATKYRRRDGKSCRR